MLNKYIKIKICSNVSNGKNAFHRVFAQYLETEFRDLRLVLNRWVTNEALSQKWRVGRRIAFKLQTKGAMDYTLHQIWHNLCPSKLNFTRPKDGWLARGLIQMLKSLTSWNVDDGEQPNSWVAVDCPLLRLAIRLTTVVHESWNVSSWTSVDNSKEIPHPFTCDDKTLQKSGLEKCGPKKVQGSYDECTDMTRNADLD